MAPLEPSKIASVLTSTAFGRDLIALTALFGDPTFVDGDRWAQFDLAGARICLASPEEGAGPGAVLVRVDELGRAATVATGAGFSVDSPVVGTHEVRQRARTASGVEIIFYCPVE
jgi:hypothetical protein